MRNMYIAGVLALLLAGGCAEDTTPSNDPECGNGVQESTEQCDGADLGGGSCYNLGFDTGILTCTHLCQFDTADCEDLPNDCGNGVIEGTEQCDDGGLGDGDGCDINCDVETGWTCEGEPSVCTPDSSCGNGVIDGDDQCESGDLDGQTCLSLGFDGGMLSCNQQDCTFNTSLCTGGPCGNGTLDLIEECDGALLGGASCVSLGYAWGDLACAPDCTYDESGCSNDPCGDGDLDPGEECDSAELDGEDCVSQGYLYGSLACASDCTFDESGCSNDPCGNGTVDTGEDCDTTDLNGADCVSEGFYWGTLACDGSCNFDTSGCSSDPCGNGSVDSPEDCDGADLNSQTCQTLGYLTGTLTCDASCVFDESACVSNICGNGTVEAPEECDDGNLVSGDGCSSTCQWEQCTADGTLTCGVQISGAALLAPDDITGYTCGAAAATLGDHVYSFVAQNTGLANAQLDVVEEDSMFGDDLDLYVLESLCVAGQCVGYGNNNTFPNGVDENFTFQVFAGQTYYVVVETVYWGLLSQLDYHLTVTCP